MCTIINKYVISYFIWCVDKISHAFKNFFELKFVFFLRTDLCRNREAAESEACATMGLGN